MSRKHNAKHPERGQSRYPERLARRGMSTAAVRMDDLPTLRKRGGEPTAYLEQIPFRDHATGRMHRP